LGLERRQVRVVFEKRFSATRMARDYLAAYMRLIGIQEARAS
ncbi:MAG: glycosyltransferase family 4 protein, partial [Mesorhizobium sp.]